MNKLKIHITRDGCSQVNVIEQIAFAEHTLHWVFNLANDESVVLSEFYNDHCFIVVDSTGCIQAFDFHTRQRIFNMTLNVRFSCVAKISHDGASVHCTYSDDQYRNIYCRLSLTDFSQEISFVLPESIEAENFTETEDDKLLFYTRETESSSDEDEDEDEEVWRHGFVLVDPITQTNQLITLINAPRAHGFFRQFHPRYSKCCHYAGMPNWTQVEYKERNNQAGDAKEEAFYTYKYDVIDLKTFDVHTISIRDIETKKLCLREKRIDRMVEGLQHKRFSSEAYAEAQTDFLETMCSSFFTGTDIWFAWREGVFRRFNIKSSTLSPLIVVNNSISDPGTPSLDTFYPTIVEVSGTRLLLNSLERYWFIDISDIDSYHSDDVLPLKMLPHDAERYIQTTPEQKKRKRLLGYYSVQVEDFDSDESLLFAIKLLADENNDIEKMCRGENLRFILTDRNDNELDEETFFKRVAAIEEAQPYVAELIEKFLVYFPECASLYIDQDASSLCYASYYLLLENKSYFALVLKHLEIIDYDHDFIFQDEIIPSLLAHFSGTEEEGALRVALPIFPITEGTESYLLEEYNDEKSWFHSWINNIKDKSVVRMIRHLESCQPEDEERKDYILEALEEYPVLYSLYSEAFNSDEQIEDKIEIFKPHWLLRNKHIQTMYATLFRKPISLDIERETFELDDGDFVECFWLDKPKAETNKPIVVLFHGLEGSFESLYIQGMMKALQSNGYASVLMHFRGCSGKDNRLPRSYHSGDTADANAWLAHLKEAFPDAPLYGVGYSLGANMLLKLLGESGGNSMLKAAVAISAPMLLSNSADTITKGTSRIYQQYLLKPLKQKLLVKYQQHDMETLLETSLSKVKKIQTVREFDDVYTSKISGFKDAEDYYEQNSAKQFLPKIKINTLIIHALDDPFMTPDVLPSSARKMNTVIDEKEASPSIQFDVQQYGGHVGFIEGSLFKPEYYLERRVLEFLQTSDA